MTNRHDVRRDACQLFGGQASCGYDWWWHSFTARHAVTGEEKPFFIEFFACNPALGEEEPILGQKPENKKRGAAPSYVMVKCGSWGKDAAQLHAFYGWRQDGVSLSMDVPFSVAAGDCTLGETHTCGSVSLSPEEAAAHPEYMSDAGTMSWDLTIRKDIAFNVGYGAGRLFRRIQLFEMFWHAEGIRTEYEGRVTWNGETYIVTPETCFGYADKNWGKDFTSPWVWLSSCRLTSTVTGKRLEHSAFDIGGGCPKVGPIALKRKLLASFTYEGKDYEFNFSKFWTFTRTKFDCRETEEEIVWHVEQKTWQNRMVTDITCRKEDMLLVNYESPDGQKRHNRLWNGGNGRGTVSLWHRGKLIDTMTCENIGCEYGEYDK